MTRRLSRSSFAASVQSVNKYGYSVIVVYIYTSHWVGRTFLLGTRYHTVYPVLSDSGYPYMKHSCTTPLEGCEVLKGSWPRGQGSPSCSLLLLWSCGFVSALHHCADLRFAICPLLAIPAWKLSLSPCHPYDCRCCHLSPPRCPLVFHNGFEPYQNHSSRVTRARLQTWGCFSRADHFLQLLIPDSINEDRRTLCTRTTWKVAHDDSPYSSSY
jgi:hypothetical protein